MISGAANPARAARAMDALDAQLLQRDPPLAVLFTPPFEKSVQEPGYVKAYPRGIRENGGQYTHAAVWTAIAFAMQGNADRALEVFNMLNPIRRSMTRADVQRYKVEPYVVAADVYSEAPHAGRGGWTWYTGSAGWLYRAGLEWILGFRLRENRLTITPCVPARVARLHDPLSPSRPAPRVALRDHRRQTTRPACAAAVRDRRRGADRGANRHRPPG